MRVTQELITNFSKLDDEINDIGEKILASNTSPDSRITIGAILACLALIQQLHHYLDRLVNKGEQLHEKQ